MSTTRLGPNVHTAEDVVGLFMAEYNPNNAFHIVSESFRKDMSFGVGVLRNLLKDPYLSSHNTHYLLKHFNTFFHLLTDENPGLCDLVADNIFKFATCLNSAHKTAHQLLTMMPMAKGRFAVLVDCCFSENALNTEFDDVSFDELLEVASDRHLVDLIEASMKNIVKGYTPDFLTFACQAYLYRLPLKHFKSRFIDMGEPNDSAYGHRLDAMTKALALAPDTVTPQKTRRFIDMIWDAACSREGQEQAQFNRFEASGIPAKVFAYKPNRQEAMLCRDIGL